MHENQRRVKITEIEEIKFQSDNIVGLSNIFALYLDFANEDEYLRVSMECLVNEASRLQDKCNILLEKMFPSKKSEADN